MALCHIKAKGFVNYYFWKSFKIHVKKENIVFFVKYFQLQKNNWKKIWEKEKIFQIIEKAWTFSVGVSLWALKWLVEEGGK